MDNKVRIQKIIAESGYCSRRKAEFFIESGAVKVNGRPVSLGDKANSKNDIITVNGEKITGQVLRYLKMYKPRGYITTMSDRHGKKLINDLMGDIKERVYPVGRLDKSSEGLILLTNDGNFANEIAHPRHETEKVYRITIPSPVSEEKIALMSAGIEIGQGETTKPCVINELVIGNRDNPRTVLELTITEGKNRQIRRMCEAVGLTVSRLKRTSVGGVKLGMLRPGEYADLTKEELKILKAGKALSNI
ncbi:MAG: rRNA pseudouridine synthase [Eubacterium sp.]|jgi:23S rRNA pseudouridine2605 synthase|nr:rRNA pseudouridine synthase [Eubacterium sp.]